MCVVDWVSGFYVSMFRSPPHSSFWKYIFILLLVVVGGISVSAMGRLLGATWVVCFGFIDFLLVRLSPDLLLYRLLVWVGFPRKFQVWLWILLWDLPIFHKFATSTDDVLNIFSLRLGYSLFPCCPVRHFLEIPSPRLFRRPVIVRFYWSLLVHRLTVLPFIGLIPCKCILGNMGRCLLILVC